MVIKKTIKKTSVKKKNALKAKKTKKISLKKSIKTIK
ncbi:uncharacterized protein METZ01_LOCUS291961, partial [marine metagenome]